MTARTAARTRTLPISITTKNERLPNSPNRYVSTKAGALQTKYNVKLGKALDELDAD
jgi:hypothetical protein